MVKLMGHERLCEMPVKDICNDFFLKVRISGNIICKQYRVVRKLTEQNFKG